MEMLEIFCCNYKQHRRSYLKITTIVTYTYNLFHVRVKHVFDPSFMDELNILQLYSLPFSVCREHSDCLLMYNVFVY